MPPPNLGEGKRKKKKKEDETEEKEEEEPKKKRRLNASGDAEELVDDELEVNFHWCSVSEWMVLRLQQGTSIAISLRDTVSSFLAEWNTLTNVQRIDQPDYNTMVFSKPVSDSLRRLLGTLSCLKKTPQPKKLKKLTPAPVVPLQSDVLLTELETRLSELAKFVTKLALRDSDEWPNEGEVTNIPAEDRDISCLDRRADCLTMSMWVLYFLNVLEKARNEYHIPFISSAMSPLTVIRGKQFNTSSTEMCVLTEPAPISPLRHTDACVVTTIFNVFAYKNIVTATDVHGDGALRELGHPVPPKSVCPPPTTPGVHGLVISGLLPRTLSQIDTTPVVGNDQDGGRLRATIVFVTAPVKTNWESDWARLGSVSLDVLTGFTIEFEKAKKESFLAMWMFIEGSFSTICHLVDNSVGDLRARTHTHTHTQALRKHNTRTHTQIHRHIHKHTFKVLLLILKRAALQPDVFQRVSAKDFNPAGTCNHCLGVAVAKCSKCPWDTCGTCVDVTGNECVCLFCASEVSSLSSSLFLSISLTHTHTHIQSFLP